MLAIVGKASSKYERIKVPHNTKQGQSIPLRNQLVTKGKGATQTWNMGVKRPCKCSNCKKIGHNKSTCLQKRGRSDDSDPLSPSKISLNDQTMNLNGDYEYPWEIETENCETSYMREETNNAHSGVTMYNSGTRSPFSHNTRPLFPEK